MEKIMTDFPKKTAKINCCLLTFDNPATILMMDDGENGKQSKMNNGPNPCRSTHEVTWMTCLFRFIFIMIFLLPNLRMRKKTAIDPKDEPIQEYKKPLNSPYATLFAITKTNSGKKGKNASMNGNKMPRKGPNFSYLSSSSSTISKNSLASSIASIVVMSTMNVLIKSATYKNEQYVT